MKFAALSIGAALAVALTAQAALAAPAENARGQSQQVQPQQSARGAGAGAGDSDGAPAATRRPTISMQTAIDIVRRRMPGQQSNVVVEGVNYRVRWKADNGRLIDYVIDGQTGAIRSAQGE